MLMFENNSPNFWFVIVLLVLFKEEVDLILARIDANLFDILNDARGLIVFEDEEIIGLIENKGDAVKSVVLFDFPIGL